MNKPSSGDAIAYLLGEYPHIRHAYILREIRGLRNLGWRIETLAVRGGKTAGREETNDEKEERSRCFYLVHAGFRRILIAHLATVFKHPAGYSRGFLRAFRYSRWNGRGALYAVAYFTEAVVAVSKLEWAGIRHVHTHYASTIAWLMNVISGIDVSMSIHGSGEFENPRDFRLTEKIAASRFVRAISYFGQSQLMRWCDRLEWNKLEVCRLGVNPGAGTERPVRDLGGPFRLLCVGGMAPPRAFDVLIRALGSVREPAIRLTLVGDGPDRPALERLAADCGVSHQVEFAGWRTQDQLPAYYAAADAFVFSSFAEGIPVVLMEAMAASLTCVAPAIGGIPELIRDGVDGTLVPPSDAAGMAAAIAKLFHDPELCRQMGASARARIAAEYHLERNVEAMSEMLSRRIPSSPGPAPTRKRAAWKETSFTTRQA